MSKVFNMVGGGGGPAASIFVTGLSDTDNVTATNGSKIKAGVWTQKPNPAAHGLPDGYTELECIIGGSTQYINTGFTPNQDTRVVLDHKFMGNTATRVGFSSRVNSASRGFVYGADYNGDKTAAFVQYGGTYDNAGNLYASERHTVDFNKNNFYHDDVLKKSFTYTSFTTPGPMYLFAANDNGSVKYISDMVLYGCQIYDNGTLIRDFIPAKRNSDSIVGLYDIVNGIFYENAGTGTFVAGPEISQTIDGFLIKPIRDLGTWTVTATNGTNTATQDVLVDVITEYDIEMTYKLWLYKNGDECTDVTGGWSVITSSTGTMSKQDDGIQINVGPGDGTYCNIGIANTIDVTEYSKLTMRTSEVTYLHCSAVVGLTLCTGTTPVKTTAYYTRPSASTSTLKISPDDLVVEDISSMTGSYNVVLVCETGGAYSDSKINYKVYEVWIE